MVAYGETVLDQLASRTGPSIKFAVDLHGGWRSVTYDELLTKSRRVARVLRTNGVSPGDRVICCIPTGPQFLFVLFWFYFDCGVQKWDENGTNI